MQYGVHVEGVDGISDRIGVPYVSLNQRSPPDETLMPGGEIIDHNRKIATSAQGFAGMSADIAGTSGNEDRV